MKQSLVFVVVTILLCSAVCLAATTTPWLGSKDLKRRAVDQEPEEHPARRRAIAEGISVIPLGCIILEERLLEFANAVDAGNVQGVREFLDNERDATIKLALSAVFTVPHSFRFNVLQLAARSGGPEVLRLLLQVAARNPELAAILLTRPVDGDSALSSAIRLDHREEIQALLTFAARHPHYAHLVLASDPYGASPLRDAVFHDRREVAQALLNFVHIHPDIGATLTAPNYLAETPYEIALRLSRASIVAMFVLFAQRSWFPTA